MKLVEIIGNTNHIEIYLIYNKFFIRFTCNNHFIRIAMDILKANTKRQLLRQSKHMFLVLLNLQSSQI